MIFGANMMHVPNQKVFLRAIVSQHQCVIVFRCSLGCQKSTRYPFAQIAHRARLIFPRQISKEFAAYNHRYTPRPEH